MEVSLLPGILKETCSGDKRHAIGCPNKFGKCWMGVRLIHGILEGTCSMREDILLVVLTSWGSAGWKLDYYLVYWKELVPEIEDILLVVRTSWGSAGWD